MVYETSSKVYACCGQYIVPTKAVSNKKIICPRCKQVLIKPCENPKRILIVKA